MKNRSPFFFSRHASISSTKIYQHMNDRRRRSPSLVFNELSRDREVLVSILFLDTFRRLLISRSKTSRNYYNQQTVAGNCIQEGVTQVSSHVFRVVIVFLFHEHVSMFVSSIFSRIFFKKYNNCVNFRCK